MNANIKPKISVVITNYNYQNYVKKSIDSVLAQDYDNIECIVVDDGSTDGSAEVINTYSQIEKVFKPNGGLTDAAGAGLRVATGDLVLFLDADDYLIPTTCSRIAAVYDENATLYSYKLIKVNIQGEKVGVWPAEPPVRDAPMKFARTYGYIPVAPTSGSAYARSHADAMFAKMLPGQKRYGFDGFVSFSAPFRGKVVYLEEFLGYYLVHGSNMSGVTKTEKSLMHHVQNALYQCSGVILAEKDHIASVDEAAGLLTPYQMQRVFLLKKAFGNAKLLPGWSTLATAAKSIEKFWTYPSIPLAKRIKNTIIVMGLAVLPGKMVKSLTLG